MRYIDSSWPQLTYRRVISKTQIVDRKSLNIWSLSSNNISIWRREPSTFQVSPRVQLSTIVTALFCDPGFPQRSPGFWRVLKSRSGGTFWPTVVWRWRWERSWHKVKNFRTGYRFGSYGEDRKSQFNCLSQVPDEMTNFEICLFII
jgi:hypothetical protein